MARALGQGWRSEAQSILWSWVRNYEDADSRMAVLRVIAESLHDDPTTLPGIQDRATNDPEPKTRWAALWAIRLGWSGDAQALAFLQDRETNDPAVRLLLYSWGTQQS